MSLTKETIEERRDVIIQDIQTVKERLAALDKQRTEDTSLLNALMGAVQQCDNFLKEFDDDVGDDGNDEDQSIPSVTFPPKCN